MKQKEIAFLSAIKLALSKFTNIDKRRTGEEKNTALQDNMVSQ
ncbi:MAG: hypothetical protein PSN04_09405 [Methyloprofundus sp.]|nr:hypothetical protein [Methyloprofundus sp.]